MSYSAVDATMENVYHAHKDSAWTLTEVADLASLFRDWEEVTASPLRAGQVSLTRITATDLTGPTGQRADVVIDPPIAGGAAGPILPANVTWAVKANIGERGKGRNGRTYWIGLSEDMVILSQMDPTIGADIVAALNTLRTTLPASTLACDLGIIHQYVAKVHITPAPFSPIVVWSATDLLIDSQRDRLPGHKRHKRPTS
jgi:hypothetical protein